MKVIKATLVVLLLIVSALILVGVFVPEVDDECDIKINRSVIEVYAAMANMQQAQQWVIGLDSVKQTSGFLAMPGSTFKFYYSGKETKDVYDMEVLEMVPLQSVKFKLSNEMFEFVISLKFESEGAGTIINVYSQMKGKGLVARSFLPLLKSSISESGMDNLEAFKQLQEK